MDAVLDMLRVTAWKVADRAFVLADWDGFRAACLSDEGPAEPLRWCARLLSSPGLLDGWWFVPYALAGAALGGAAWLLLPCRRRWLAAFVSVGLFVSFHPLWTMDTAVWTDPEPAAALMNTLGLFAAALLALAGRRFARGPYAPLAQALACCALFPFLGLYALLAGLWGVLALFLRRRRLAGCVAALALAGTPPLAAAGLYGNQSLSIALDRANAFRTRFAPPQPIGPMLAMERCVRAGDWTGVLKIADARRAAGCAYPLRMEIAYRILAQFHLGRLPDDLFAYPIRTCHLANAADELFMDGNLLLFGYGFLLPARREIFERSAMSGLEPGQLRLLGDIALLRHETRQAFRHYALLSRCPFRNAFALRRLNFMYGKSTEGADDLREIASLAAFLESRPRSAENAFYAGGQNVEGFVYAAYRAVSNASPGLARFVLALALLEGDEELVVRNLALLGRLYPSPSAWPDVIREALLVHAAGLDAAARRKFAGTLPDGAVTPAAEARFNRFLAAAKASGPEALLPEFGDTYSFYRSFVAGGGR